MMTSDVTQLDQFLTDLRQRLESVFGPATSAPGFTGSAPSTGHCAAVSVIASKLLGASMVSTKIQGQSHWFNRLRVGDREIDFDLTGDQYGFCPVRYSDANKLYPGTKVRAYQDLNAETLRRARLLASKAGLDVIA